MANKCQTSSQASSHENMVGDTGTPHYNYNVPVSPTKFHLYFKN